MFEPDWAPSVQDVGSVIRARTKDSFGNELGTFTADTRPTDQGASDLIETAIAEVSGEVGTVPDGVQDNARRVTALYAASLIELGYYPEQINSGRSPYNQLIALYNAALTKLKLQVAELEDGGELNNDEQLPQFYFDAACDAYGNPPGSVYNPTGLIGMKTRW